MTSSKKRVSRILWRPYPKGIAEVVDAPGDDHVVVAADDDGDHRRADPDPTEPRVDHVPDPEGSLPEFLTDGQFKQNERHTLEDHHDEEGEDEGACKTN